jgi:Flp pilus assembly protein TadD
MSGIVIHDEVNEELDYPEDDDLLIFVSNTDVARAQHLLSVHQTDLGEVAGFEQEELDALYAKGMELLRLGMHRQSGKVFFSLVLLRPMEGRFYRGLALAYHYERNFSWARVVYGQALAYDPTDIISMALRAECTLLIRGKREAMQELTHVLSLPPRNRHDAPYLERARALADKLSIYREELS